MKSLSEYIKNLLENCPFIEIVEGNLNTDFNEQSPTNYSIEGEPVNPILKKYLNGDTQRQYTFTLSAMQFTTNDNERVDNMGAYENITSWFEEQTRKRKLPKIDEERQPITLETVGAGYLMERQEDNAAARYAMQCRLTYYQKVRK